MPLLALQRDTVESVRLSRNYAVGLGSARVSRAAEPSRRRFLVVGCGQTKRSGSVRESNGVRRDAEHGTRDACVPLNGIDSAMEIERSRKRDGNSVVFVLKLRHWTQFHFSRTLLA